MPGPSLTEAGVGFGVLAMTTEKLRELDAHGWELYRITDDFSETENVADANPEILRELISIWYVEAGRFDVLPIDSSGTARFAVPRPQLTRDRTHYTFFPHTSPIPENVAPRLFNRAYSITADVEIPRGGASGALISYGGNAGGYSFFIKDRRLWFVHNYLGVREMSVVSNVDVPEGKTSLRFEFEPTGAPDIAHGKGTPGHAQLYINRKLVGEAEFPITVPLTMGLGGGLCCGKDPGSPVSTQYVSPFEFTGRIDKLVVDVSGDLIRDTEAEMHAAMAHQ